MAGSRSRRNRPFHNGFAYFPRKESRSRAMRAKPLLGGRHLLRNRSIRARDAVVRIDIDQLRFVQRGFRLAERHERRDDKEVAWLRAMRRAAVHRDDAAAFLGP